MDLTPSIRTLARTVPPAAACSLDAIHLAAAWPIRGQLTAFVTYDNRLAAAAAGAGLGVEMPA